MNWKRYRRYYNRLSKVERNLIQKRQQDWFDGHDGFKEMTRGESNIASDMFRAGWIAARIETDDDPILEDCDQNERNNNDI